jgi:hypothetical protein
MTDTTLRDSVLEILEINGDDLKTYGVESISLFGSVARGEADYVKGDRLRHSAVWRDMPLHRLLGTSALAWMTRHAAGLSSLSDSQCGYTAIGAGAMDCLLR